MRWNGTSERLSWARAPLSNAHDQAPLMRQAVA